ncbi:MAG: hypothetical protein IJ389_03125 [Clostridia bacterium]|nr:hypothetical protein [Clostridia bacterium]
MTILFLCLFAVSLVYCLFIHFLCMKKKAVLRISRIYRLSAAVGAIIFLLTLIVYYARLLTLDNEGVASVISTVFLVYIVPVAVLSILIFALSLAAHLTRQRLAFVTPYISHLTSIFILLWTLIYEAWSYYEEFEITLYIQLTGIAISLILLYPAHLCYKRFALRFDDKEFMKIRKYGDPKKLEHQQEKQHIRETKARIKSQTKKK